MTTYGFHASHEQIPPSRLLAAVREAEQAGFEAAMCSDHWAPWSSRQGESGFAWSWLGAALEATSLPFGVVSAPGQRYHPAIIAQAAATLAEMYPGRFWVALGSGQALNEHVTGDAWPPKDRRNARLRECVEVMRALFAGEEVTHDGLVRVERARLWTRPEEPPPLFGAAVTPETAAWVAGWADGLITINQPREDMEATIGAFREAAGDDRPVRLQVHVSWAADEEEALALAHDQWREAGIGSGAGWELPLPEHFEQAASNSPPEAVRDSVFVSAEADAHVEWLAGLTEFGPEQILVHHVGQEQGDFLEVYGDRVLPALR
jgi:probable non-F420 flavinoid oxidoreductase